MWHFFLGQSTALTLWANQACTLFLSPSHFFLFFLSKPSLSHLYTHISCSSTNQSCKVNVSMERSLYMKTNEQVTQWIEPHFSTHWVFIFQHKLCFYLTGKMDISSRSSPRLKAKEKMFKHLLLALLLTLWAESFIRGHKAPINGWAESDILDDLNWQAVHFSLGLLSSGSCLFLRSDFCLLEPVCELMASFRPPEILPHHSYWKTNSPREKHHAFSPQGSR